MKWIMLTILLQTLPQSLFLAIEERQEKIVAITTNYKSAVGRQNFQNYRYGVDHYKGRMEKDIFVN